MLSQRLGGVVGVNSGGWTFLEGSPLAHVALLWPALNTEIDLFKSGGFPAIDLFAQGPMKAIGYRRVHVTSTGEVRLANINREDLQPCRLPWRADVLGGALDFSVSNTKQAMGDLRTLLDKAFGTQEPLDVNGLHLVLRHFFWELDTILRLALRLTASRAGIDMETELGWDQLAIELRTRLDRQGLDEVSTLEFSWYGIDLFEIRTYAEFCREGILHVIQCTADDRGLIEVILDTCRKGGRQIMLPDGIERLFESTRRFVLRLLSLTSGMNSPAL